MSNILKAKEVPPAIIVNCPFHQMGVQVCKTCGGCKHFKGVQELNPHTQYPWEQRHLVLCDYPRKLQVMRTGVPSTKKPTVANARVG